MILSDVSKRTIKSDNLREVIAIFEKTMYRKNEINAKVGEFKGEICYEIEIIYPVGDYFNKEEVE